VDGRPDQFFGVFGRPLVQVDAPESSQRNESLLVALENAWNQAQLHHDSKALDGLVADTFISTDNDGTFMTKAQFLADNKDLSYAPSVMTNTDERVFLHGNTAIIAGIYHAKGSIKVSPSIIMGDSPIPGST
jgi:uncharacterized protein DUF4440